MSPSASTEEAPTRYRYKHIVVVHGIGDHKPNETALDFMNEFIRNLPNSGRYRVEPRNLIASVDPAIAGDHAFRPSYFVFTDLGAKCAEPPEQVHVISFSEVYWKPITSEYLNRNEGPPIPIPTWADSIGTRLLGPGYDLRQWKAAIDNLDSTLDLLRKASLLYGKSGELAKILDRFLGDVQMYAESDDLRLKIDRCFLDVLSKVEGFSRKAKDAYRENSDETVEFEKPKIYIVAHSEGTVVSLSSLVRAAHLKEGNRGAGIDEYEGNLDSWLPRVDGLVTLGSPIDKHYSIWRTRFQIDLLKSSHVNAWGHKIPWYNFWDQSDPVGYGLTSVYPDAQADTDAAKLFDVKYDRGFSRYPLPGKAHIDYWKDTGIHRKIIREVMKLTPDADQAPIATKWARVMPWVDYLAYLTVRLATLLVIFAAVDLLCAKVLHGAAPHTGDTLLALLHRLQWLFPLPRMVLLVAGLAGCVLAVGVELLDWKLKPWLQHRKVWLPQQRDAWSRHWSDAVSVFRDTLVIAGFAAALRALWLHPPLKDHPEYWNAAICLLAPVIVGKVVGDAADFVQWPKIAKLVRGVMGCVWALGALALALALPVRNPDLGIKDAVGYLTLLAAGILGWRLHTTIHKGLVQLWRYTMDDDASAKP